MCTMCLILLIVTVELSVSREINVGIISSYKINKSWWNALKRSGKDA